jgi:hypothetical protein
MSKIFDSFQKSTIKNAAKAVAHFKARQEKIDAQIEALVAQKAKLEEEITSYEKAVADITGGFTPLELCEKVVRNAGGQSDWVFKYPSTIIPPAPETVSETETDTFPANNGCCVAVATAEQELPSVNEVRQPLGTQVANDPMNDIF